MVNIMGIDPSTYTGLAMLGVPGQSAHRLLHFKKDSGFRRLQLIAVGIESTLEEWQPDIVFIEAYALRMASAIILVEIGTIIRKVLYDHRLEWYNVAPTVLKKYTAGKGNADKAAMAQAARERWGFSASLSDDVIDAYCLAQFGQHYLTLPDRNFPGVTAGH